MSFFASPAEALLYRETFPNNANESVSSFGRSLAQSQVLAKLAADRIQLVAESVGTPAVATDMLNIVRAFGQEKLNYYGISYVITISVAYNVKADKHMKLRISARFYVSTFLVT